MMRSWNKQRAMRFGGDLWLLLPAALLLAAAIAWRPSQRLVAHAAAAAALTQPTPVRVADAACAQCHRSIVESYLRTPKADASGVAEDGLFPGSFAHTQSGATYRVSLSEKGALLDEAVPGKGIAAQQQLRYYLGSGNLGRTYLYSVDGYLLESPVAYLSSLRGYSMAPGLADVKGIPAALPMNARCMRCHMSDVQQPLPGVGNRFAGLPFLHGGITCEQCHGDTTAHVQSKGKVAVLNPAKMSAPARDSVCISCHLEGDASVALPAKSVFGWKPGQDIREYLTYFVDPSNSGRSVTEVEQLSQSKCKRTSGDRMSCTSCHDPHSRPSATERLAFYRAKCLACHSGASFAAVHHPENQDCTACHMPKAEVRDTPHVAWTDHRILRVPSHGDEKPLGQGEDLVAALPGQHISPRELGLADYNLLLKGGSRWVAPAQRNLEQAHTTLPMDADVAVALGAMYQHEGRTEEAARLYREALQTHPDDVNAASDLALILARGGNLAEARTLLQHAFNTAQDQELLGMNLTVVDCMQGDADGAKAVLQTVLRFSPGSVRARDRLQTIAANGCPVPR